ncbi:hypothetical protein M3223_02530 [Paenibacillus pasadenensis]|uniref:hypothetical protein n=1 Tax=Paenibacillus pasadenensis TaxID=217090 RepID=UPI00203C3DDD|nr:hypothetical protein [Paenibacillus pasadenensis]MCM3746226.1 hypothetical protein [Paenibacillus pasadenensis]
MNLGMVLVLFILLVIVTSVFCMVSNPDDTDPPIGITGTQTFYIENQSQFRIRFISRTGPSDLPEKRNLPPGTSTEYIVRTSSSIEPVQVRTLYYIYDSSDYKQGEFIVTMEATDLIAIAYVKGEEAKYPDNLNFALWALGRTVRAEDRY